MKIKIIYSYTLKNSIGIFELFINYTDKNNIIIIEYLYIFIYKKN